MELVLILQEEINIRVESSNATGYDLDTSLGKITISGKKTW